MDLARVVSMTHLSESKIRSSIENLIEDGLIEGSGKENPVHIHYQAEYIKKVIKVSSMLTDWDRKGCISRNDIETCQNSRWYYYKTRCCRTSNDYAKSGI